ncbi:DUF952 domain-containing protein [Aestuariispira insulae]|uniref:Uncharacterized protein (DUF952 family) n=1 Tax=Aestuariispira insulae TaxID=1461337 RepID=A0A3D9HEW7_9PROT|nr:DUF952 domain-containing protein [Aestuariispira insulae]RED48032.1 uncharacterized protein (DUF952 family) [Aestuariispira insulae]
MIIYHLARKAAWEQAERAGAYTGTPEDLADGFMHFSTAAQVAESAAKHRAGETDLILIGAEGDELGAALKWEESRGGQLFPHLYADLPLSAVKMAIPLELGPHGLHLFPDLTD